MKPLSILSALLRLSRAAGTGIILALFMLLAWFQPIEASANPPPLNQEMVVDAGGKILVRGGSIQVESGSLVVKSGATLSVGGTSIAVNDSGTGTISTVSAAESVSYVQTTVLTLADVPIVVAGDSSDQAATNAWGSVKLYDFPEGRILIHGVTVDGIAFTPDTNGFPTGANGDYSLGSVAASTNALSGTMIDLCAASALNNISATNAVNGALATSAQFDGTATALDVYLNLSVDQDDWIGGALSKTSTVGGVITINWTPLGDY